MLENAWVFAIYARPFVARTLPLYHHICQRTGKRVKEWKMGERIAAFRHARLVGSGDGVD